MDAVKASVWTFTEKRLDEENVDLVRGFLGWRERDEGLWQQALQVHA